MRTGVATLVVVLVAGLVPGPAGASLSRTDRAAIDATLDVFVPAALFRVRSGRAWPLATPAMHAGTTRASWVRGDLPVVPFPGRGRTFHDWTVSSTAPGVAHLSLLVHPRPGAKVGAVYCDITMRKVRGRWLVDSFVPAASFAAPGEVSSMTAAADFGPGSGGPAFSKSGRIGESWVLVVPGVLAGLIVLVPLAVLLAHRRRDRRAARRWASARRV